MAPLSLPDSGADRGPDVVFVVSVESPEVGVDFSVTLPMHVKEQASLHKMLAAALADMAAAVSSGGLLDSTADRSVLELLERERLKGSTKVRQIPLYRVCQTCRNRLEPPAQRGHSIATQTIQGELECSSASDRRVDQASKSLRDMECSSASDDEEELASKSLPHQTRQNMTRQHESEQVADSMSRAVEISIGQRSPEASWKRAAAEGISGNVSGHAGEHRVAGSPDSMLASSLTSTDRISTPVTTPHSSQRAGEALNSGIHGNTVSSISTSSPSRGRTLDKAEKSPLYQKSPPYQKSPHCVSSLPSGMGLAVSLSSTLEAIDVCSDVDSGRSCDADSLNGSGRTAAGRSRPPLSSCGADEQQAQKRLARRSRGNNSTPDLAISLASTQEATELTDDGGCNSSGRCKTSGARSPDTALSALVPSQRARRSPMDDSLVCLAAEEQVRQQGLPQVRHSRSLDSSMRQAAREAFNAARPISAARAGFGQKVSKSSARSHELSDAMRAACDQSDWKEAEKAQGIPHSHHTTCRNTATLSHIIFSPDFPDTSPKILRRSSSARMASRPVSASRPFSSDIFGNTTSFEKSDSARGHAGLSQTLGATMPPRLPSRQALHSPSPQPDRDMVQGMAIKKWLERAGSPSKTIT